MKKFLGLVMSLVMLLSVGLMTGCGDESWTIGAREVITVGMSPDFPPYENKVDGGKKIEGFDVDLLEYLAVKMNVVFEVKGMPFDSILAAIPSGKVQIGVSGFTINEDRAKSVLFSDSYFDNEQVLVVKSDNTTFTNELTKDQIDALLAESGMKIGACDGYVGYDYALEIKDADGTNYTQKGITTYKDMGLAAADLNNGKVKAVIMDKAVALYAAANNSGIRVLPATLTTDNYGIAMKLGNTALKAKIDAALKELKDEGTLAELVDKWAGEF